MELVTKFIVVGFGEMSGKPTCQVHKHDGHLKAIKQAKVDADFGIKTHVFRVSDGAHIFNSEVNYIPRRYEDGHKPKAKKSGSSPKPLGGKACDNCAPETCCLYR